MQSYLGTQEVRFLNLLLRSIFQTPPTPTPSEHFTGTIQNMPSADFYATFGSIFLTCSTSISFYSTLFYLFIFLFFDYY